MFSMLEFYKQYALTVTERSSPLTEAAHMIIGVTGVSARDRAGNLGLVNPKKFQLMFLGLKGSKDCG